MINLLGFILQLALQIFSEYLAVKKAAREANLQFQVDQKGFLLMVEVSIQKLRSEAPKDSAGASDGWDAADRDLPKQN